MTRGRRTAQRDTLWPSAPRIAGCRCRPNAPTTANAAEIESQKAKALASTEIYDSTLLVIDFDL